MKKHVIFLHQNYPAQFGPISEFLLLNYDVEISFFSEYAAKPVIEGVNHYFYEPKRTGNEDTPYFYSRHFDGETANMHGLHDAICEAKLADPDVFVGHAGFGTLGLLHGEFPEVPRIGFFELFYDATGRITDTRPEYPSPKPNRLRVPLRNATQLIELEYCTKGYSPTPFQKSTYPIAYQNKLEVLFDGIDTELYSPGEVSPHSELKRTWPSDAKIVTFVSRGLEAMRGFDIFMEVAAEICSRRKDVHFVIAGNPHTHYGSELAQIKERSFKQHVLKQGKYDLSRFHFLNWVSEPALVDLFRLSDCHFYWTTPFTLSWSFFQAMSAGALILGSNSLPVRDVLIDGVNGRYMEPYERVHVVECMLEMLDDPLAFAFMREHAVQMIRERYSFEQCLPKLTEFYFAQTGFPNLLNASVAAGRPS